MNEAVEKKRLDAVWAQKIGESAVVGMELERRAPSKMDPCYVSEEINHEHDTNHHSDWRINHFKRDFVA